MRVNSRVVEDALIPVDDLPCVCSRLRRATRAVARLYDQALAPFDLRTTEYSLLARLSADGPTALSPFAARLGMDRSTLTRELRSLQDAGLVVVCPGEDRRQRVVSIAPAGEHALAAARPAWLAVQADVAGRFGGERTASL